ncbi:hypothetical protein GCM10025856_23170 [Methylophaga marina]|nr:hypothetical protein GCM10025856_23170 [Methylophaga marina]
MITEGLDILIGTPGRLLDYQKQRVFSLKFIDVVVLDEADRMFDLGFIKDVRYFLRRIPKPEQRLGMLFSATLSYKVSELAYEHMNNPEKVQVEPEKMMGDRIEEWVYYPANDEKIPLLLALIKRLNPERGIIFVNTKQAADVVWGYLEGNGYKASLLSGDVPQKKRERLLQHFQDGEFPFLVATDVAARGLHIPEVSHVFNYDLPQDVEDYVHRTGRTARAGASGVAISLACEEYVFSLPDIEAYIKHKLPLASTSDEQLDTPKPRVKKEKEAAPQRKRHDANKSSKPRRRRPRQEKSNDRCRSTITDKRIFTRWFLLNHAIIRVCLLLLMLPLNTPPPSLIKNKLIQRMSLCQWPPHKIVSKRNLSGSLSALNVTHLRLNDKTIYYQSLYSNIYISRT